MSVLTKDRRYEEAIANTKEGEVTNMCAVLDRIENRGIQKGIEQGIKQGQYQGRLEIFSTLSGTAM